MVSNSPYRIITGRDDAEIVGAASRRIGDEWPEFMLHDPVADNLSYCYKHLPDFQFILLDGHTEKPVAICNSIPLAWDDALETLPDDGWDWAIKDGIEIHRLSRRANFLCALQIVVFSEYRGRGISRIAVDAMDTGPRHLAPRKRHRAH